MPVSYCCIILVCMFLSTWYAASQTRYTLHVTQDKDMYHKRHASIYTYQPRWTDFHSYHIYIAPFLHVMEGTNTFVLLVYMYILLYRCIYIHMYNTYVVHTTERHRSIDRSIFLRVYIYQSNLNLALQRRSSLSHSIWASTNEHSPSFFVQKPTDRALKLGPWGSTVSILCRCMRRLSH